MISRYKRLIYFGAGFLFLRGYALNSLFPFSVRGESLFLSDLLGHGVIIPFWITIMIGFLNLGLVWLIGRKLFNQKFADLAALVYLVSPWAIYLEVCGYISILWLAFILTAFLGLLLVDNKKIASQFLIILGILGLLCSSLVLWLVVPFLLFGLFKSGFIKGNILAVLGLFLIPFIFLFYKNDAALKNNLNRELTVFSDVGLNNAVNSFRGEINKSDFAFMAKVTENKLTYFGIHMMDMTVKQLNPFFYFTSDAGLLNFSFNPPIFLGFIIPFFLGLSFWKMVWLKYKYYCLIFLALLLPSLLSEKGIDLSKLIIIFPVLIFTISFGLSKNFKIYKNRINKYLMAVMLVLLIFQSVLFLSELPSREPIRLHFFTALNNEK
jgi:hypothetical protein